MCLKLLPYQMEAVQWCSDHENVCAILAYDMGLGKTIVSCALLMKKPIKTMIMVPTSLLDQWHSEVTKHTSGLTIAIYHSAMRKCFAYDAQVIITTPSIIANDIQRGINRFRDVKRLIIDEAHKLRNSKGKIYKTLCMFTSPIESKIFLTGTPICNRCDDVISLICLSNVKIYNSIEYWRHKNDKVKGTILKNILPIHMLRKTQDETISSILPLITYHDIRLKIGDGEQMKVYNHHVGDCVILRRILRMRQALNAHQIVAEDDFISKEVSVKIEAIKQILSTIPKDDKIILFSNFTSLLKHLYDILMLPKSEELFLYHGGLNMIDRKKVLDDFKTKANARILLVNLKAGGCGLNLIEANRVILIEPYWNDSEQQQAISRVYRLGQQKPVSVYRLIVNNSIETWLRKLQHIKKNISNILIDKNKKVKLCDVDKQKSDLLSLFRCVGGVGFSKENDEMIETLIAEFQ